MTDNQWESLLRILDGERLDPPPAGFLVDGPWVSAMSGIGLMDYFTDTQAWLRANLEAVRRFPDVLWIPGFWAEFGMISNPPSFGAKCIWPEEGFPSCETVLRDVSDVDILRQPNVRTDGLLPLIIQRLRQARPTIEAAWHRIRFACSHGPVTIGSYLLGHTEFFLACRTDPDPPLQQKGGTDVEADAGANGGVSHVEARPVQGARVHIEKIRDPPQLDTVDQVPHDAADQAADRQAVNAPVIHQPAVPKPHSRKGGQGKQHQPLVLVLQGAPHRARVAQISEVQQRRNHRARFTGNKMAQDQQLGHLIQEHDGQAERNRLHQASSEGGSGG